MNAEKDLVAVGASWCHFSKEQKKSLEDACQGKGTWDAETATCDLGNRKVGIVMCDTDAENPVCQAVQGQVAGYPTWFEKDSSSGEVTPMIKTQETTVHYVPEICNLPSMKGAKQCM